MSGSWYTYNPGDWSRLAGSSGRLSDARAFIQYIGGDLADIPKNDPWGRSGEFSVASKLAVTHPDKFAAWLARRRILGGKEAMLTNHDQP
jgi:hypothetical protein